MYGVALPVDFNARYEEQKESSRCGKVAIERRWPFHIEQSVVFVPIASGEEQTSPMKISVMTQHRDNDAQRKGQYDYMASNLAQHNHIWQNHFRNSLFRAMHSRNYSLLPNGSPCWINNWIKLFVHLFSIDIYLLRFVWYFRDMDVSKCYGTDSSPPCLNIFSTLCADQLSHSQRFNLIAT